MPEKRLLPKEWPKDIEYLTLPKYSLQIPNSTIEKINEAPDSEYKLPNLPSPSSLVTIKIISNPSHPAFDQSGLFAAKDLKPLSLVVFYMGLIHSVDDTDPKSSYDLSLDAYLGIGIDATRMGNEARFINDYRGISDKPNAEFKDVWITIGSEVQRRIGVFVLSGKGREKGIRKGQEILVSYGKGFWKARNN